jgi:hypothetical protein
MTMNASRPRPTGAKCVPIHTLSFSFPLRDCTSSAAVALLRGALPD